MERPGRGRVGRSEEHTRGGTSVMSGFRDFLLRGNVVDLAVAVVIGTG